MWDEADVEQEDVADAGYGASSSGEEGGLEVGSLGEREAADVCLVLLGQNTS